MVTSLIGMNIIRVNYTQVNNKSGAQSALLYQFICDRELGHDESGMWICN
jgi:hypothetical protein